MTRWSRGLWGVLMMGGALSNAHGHVFEHPRTLHLGVSGQRLILAIRFDASPGAPAADLRARFDRDADGSLDRVEQDKLLAYLEERNRTPFQAWLDDRPIHWTFENLSKNQVDQPASSTSVLGATWVYSAQLPKKARRVTLRLADKNPKPTPITIDIPSPWWVEMASQGEWHPDSRRIRAHLVGPDGMRLHLIRRASPEGKT